MVERCYQDQRKMKVFVTHMALSKESYYSLEFKLIWTQSRRFNQGQGPEGTGVTATITGLCTPWEMGVIKEGAML